MHDPSGPLSVPNNEDTFLAILLDQRGVRYLGKNGEASMAQTDFIFAVSDAWAVNDRASCQQDLDGEDHFDSAQAIRFIENRFMAYSDSILMNVCGHSSRHDQAGPL